MKSRFCFILLCNIFLSSSFCKAEIYDWFTLNDKVIYLSNIQVNFYQYFQTGEYNHKGIKTGYGSLRWSNLVFCITDKQDKRFKFSYLPGIFLKNTGNFISLGLSDMWFSFHYKVIKNSPFITRLAIKLNGHDSENFLRQNDLDLGVLYGTGNKRQYFESSISYRYRFRGVRQHEFDINFDRPGNEIHYKFDIGKYYLPDIGFSGFILGYWGFEKYYQKEKIADSASSKLSIGTQFNFGPPEKSNVSASFMIDLIGENESAGWFVNFQFGK